MNESVNLKGVENSVCMRGMVCITSTGTQFERLNDGKIKKFVKIYFHIRIVSS